MQQKKTLLVTGHDGFIGRHLIKATQSYSLILYGKDITKNIKLNKKVDCVVHLAAKTDSRESKIIPAEYYKVNVLGTLNILEFCKKNKAKLVFTSTGQVCGTPKYLGVDESHPTAPENPYTKSKLLSENLCKNYSDDFNISCVILRLFNVYGPGQRENFFIPKVLHAAKKNKKLELNSPDTKRDFIYISDVIDAIISATEYNKGKFDIFHIGTDKSNSVKEIIELAQKISKKKISVEYTFERKEVQNIYANINKAKKLLGFIPNTELKKGIEKTYNSL